MPNMEAFRDYSYLPKHAPDVGEWWTSVWGCVAAFEAGLISGDEAMRRIAQLLRHETKGDRTDE